MKAATTSGSMEGLAMFVLSGRFIAFRPTHYALQWIERGQMRPILPRRLSYRSHFHAVIRKTGTPSLVMRGFLLI